VCTFISRIVAVGGADPPEDVKGALKQGLKIIQ
jgi:hypothetical protein